MLQVATAANVAWLCHSNVFQNVKSLTFAIYSISEPFQPFDTHRCETRLLAVGNIFHQAQIISQKAKSGDGVDLKAAAEHFRTSGMLQTELQFLLGESTFSMSSDFYDLKVYKVEMGPPVKKIIVSYFYLSHDLQMEISRM